MSNSRPTVLFLSVPRAAKKMGVGVRRLKRAVRDGQIPAIQLGRQKVVSVAVIERLAQVKVSA